MYGAKHNIEMDVASNQLAYYLNRIHTFLITDEKSQVFPILTMAMEDMLVKIGKDTAFLKQGQFDDNCKSVAAQIITVLEKNKETFTLSYEFENDLYGKKVMVYKKKPVFVFKEPAAIKPLRKPKIIEAATKNVSKTNTVMSSFKTTCLNSTLRFVKNESQLILQYPDMTTEQMEFVRQMVSKCLSRKEDTPEVGFRGLYDPLADALKMFGLKYDFKLTDVVAGHCDMMRLQFEKIPKHSRNMKEKDQITSGQMNKNTGNILLSTRNVKSQGSNNLQITVNTTPIAKAKTENSKALDKNAKNKTENSKALDKDAKDKTENSKALDKNAKGKTENSKALDKNAKDKTENSKALDKNAKDKTENIRGLYKNMSNANNKTGNTVGSDKDKSTNAEDKTENTKGLGKNMSVTKSLIETENKVNSKMIDEDVISICDSSFSTTNSEKRTKKLKNIQPFVASVKNLDEVFKKNTIIVIKEFLTGNTEKLVFASVGKHEAGFLKHWKTVVNRVEVVQMFDVEGQMVLDEIRDAVAMRNLKVNVTEQVLDNNRSVTFMKGTRKTLEQLTASTTKGSTTEVAAKTNANGLNSISNSSLSSYSTPTNNKPRPKFDAKTEKFLNTTESLSEEWIKMVLTQLKEFIIEKTQASLLVPRVTPPQATFLIGWMKGINGVTAVIETYQQGVQVVLRDVRRALSQIGSKFTISMKEGRVTKTQVRDIMFVKNPVFPIKQPANSLSEDNGIKAKTNNAKTVPVMSNVPVPQITKSFSLTSLPPEPVVRGIEHGRPKSAKVVPRAKAKLIEGLNQPLVSEKGLKMMKCMGWEGGALGARGEGIVEPIALCLDMGNRAGLGSIRPPPKLPSSSLPSNISCFSIPHQLSRAEIKTRFLQTILMLLQESRPAIELTFANQLPAKSWSFVRHIVYSFNIRAVVSMEQSADHPMCLRISDMMNLCDLIITACWGLSKRNILFILSDKPYEPNYNGSKHWSDVVNIDINSKENMNEVRGKHCSENIMVDGEAFRYYVMVQILDFCLNSNDKIYEGPSKGTVEKVYSLKGTMTPKHLSFIQDVILRLNRRSRASTNSKNICELFDEILTRMQGFSLHVDFPVTKNADKHMYESIRFHKIFDEKSVSNSQNKPKTGKADKIRAKSVEPINKKIINNRNENTENSKNVEKDSKNAQSEHKSTEKRTTLRDKFDCNAPTNSQNTTNNTQSAPNNSENVQINNEHCNDVTVNKDCARFNSGNDNIETVQRKADKFKRPVEIIETESVEYIFIDKESVETENSVYICQPIGFKTDTSNDKSKSDKKENERPKITGIDKEENDRPMFTRIDKEDNDRPMFTRSDKKENERPKITESDKEENDRAMITESNKQENERPMFTERDKKENERPKITESDKEENDRPVITGRDKEENERQIITGSDKKENERPIITESDKEKNERPKITASDKEENGMPVITETERIVESDKANNNTPIVTDKEETIQKHIHIQNTKMTEGVNNDLVNFNNLTLHLECAENLLKEFAENSQRDLITALPVNKDGSQEKETKYYGKRLSSIALAPERKQKKSRYENYIKHINIIPQNYPQNKINKKMAAEIQKSISESIDYTQELPLLKCQGIQDGALSYSCYTENSLQFIENVIKSLDLEIIAKLNQERRHKMAFRINTYIEESVDTIFERLEKYNLCLNTNDWDVIKKEQGSDFIVIYVEIDENSFKFIRNEKFTIFAGIDEASFSIVWG